MKEFEHDAFSRLTTEQLIDLILDNECECRILKLSNKVTQEVYFEINDLTCESIDIRGALQFYLINNRLISYQK